ncbi:MAG: hypothetical protein ACD_81C00218G0009 [uncultured bacterium]|nr:MAG: hypothetical protein ACD_81C00218G0009 [uncultured bacterium]
MGLRIFMLEEVAYSYIMNNYKNGFAPIFVILLIVVAVLAIGSGAYYIGSKKNSKGGESPEIIIPTTQINEQTNLVDVPINQQNTTTQQDASIGQETATPIIPSFSPVSVNSKIYTGPYHDSSGPVSVAYNTKVSISWTSSTSSGDKSQKCYAAYDNGGANKEKITLDGRYGVFSTKPLIKDTEVTIACIDQNGNIGSDIIVINITR